MSDQKQPPDMELFWKQVAAYRAQKERGRVADGTFTWVRARDFLRDSDVLRSWAASNTVTRTTFALQVPVSHSASEQAAAVEAAARLVGAWSQIYEKDDRVDAIVTIPGTGKEVIIEAKASPHVIAPKSIESGESFGVPTIKPVVSRPVAMPAGYRMSQVLGWVFFFSPKTVRRLSEENVADYRWEMTDAEAKGKSAGELRKIKIQHWGGFAWCVLVTIVDSTVFRLLRMIFSKS